MMTLAAVLSLASICIPPDMPKLRQRMVAHAMVESGFDPLAIHDNATKVSYRPQTIEHAERIVAQLSGHPLDAGIAQITFANWEKTGLRSARLLFDATTNFCAGTIILAQDYEAACRYNTGKPNCENGYPEAIARAQAVIARNGDLDDPTYKDKIVGIMARNASVAPAPAKPTRSLASQFPTLGDK